MKRVEDLQEGNPFRRRDGEPLCAIGQETARRLQSGEPLYIMRTDGLGDGMIIWWSTDLVMRKLCQEIGIDIPRINIQTYFEGKHQPNQVLLTSDSFTTKISNSRPDSFYSEAVHTIARVVSLPPISKNEINLPQPLQTDYPPLDKFSKEIVAQNGEALREIIQKQGKPLIVVAQSGSQSEKRFSDSQVAKIADAVKSSSPDSFVAVVTDKPFLRAQKIQLIERLLPFARPSAPLFPFYTKEFQRELRSVNFGKAPDAIILTKDINEICKWFYAADTLITTDSFWSWLGAGTKAMRPDSNGQIQSKDAVVLHTVAYPQVWGVPGATHISSECLDYFWDLGFVYQTNGHMLYLNQYYSHLPIGERPSPHSSARGITPEDIDLLIQTSINILTKY